MDIVEKIIAEIQNQIVRTQYYILERHGEGEDTSYGCGGLDYLTAVLNFIRSLQEGSGCETDFTAKGEHKFKVGQIVRHRTLGNRAKILDISDDGYRCDNAYIPFTAEAEGLWEVASKFTAGDRIRPIDSALGSPRTIIEVDDGWYYTDKGPLDFEYEDNWELVEDHFFMTAAESLGIPEEEYEKIENELFSGKEEPVKKDYRERYKRIAQSESFKKTHEGMGIGEVIPFGAADSELVENTITVPDGSTLIIENGKIVIKKGKKCLDSSCKISKDLQENDLEAEISKWLNDGFPNEEELVGYIKETARHFANWGKKQAEIEIQAQSMAIAHDCPKQSVEEAMAEIEEKSKAFTEAHAGESADDILAEMRGEEPAR